jgi:hypothetical protein
LYDNQEISVRIYLCKAGHVLSVKKKLQINIINKYSIVASVLFKLSCDYRDSDPLRFLFLFLLADTCNWILVITIRS